MTPADLFRRAGAALYGEQFVAPLAVALGLTKNTVGKWVDGKWRIPLGIWSELEVLIVGRQEELQRVAIAVFEREKKPPAG